MFKQIVSSFMILVILSGCATTQIPHQSGIGRVSENSTYVVDSNKETYQAEVQRVLHNRTDMVSQQAVAFDRRNKPAIRAFMERTKVSMQICQTAIDTQNIVKETMLVACEPFFRDLETARFGDNEMILRRYGMGGKIALALLAGVAGAAMYNSNDFGSVVASGAIMVTAAQLASIPNDWNAISPYMSKVEANAYNKWLILHINDQVSQ